jgi:nitrite reductase (NO-forming)
MQGGLYTARPFGEIGLQEFSFEKLISERPEYFTFNGSVGALTEEHPMHAKTGETVGIYFGVSGPNYTSSFHVIGTIFDRVYAAASLTTPPLTGVQTVTVPPGGATAVDLSLPVPGRFVMVDHALFSHGARPGRRAACRGPPSSQHFPRRTDTGPVSAHTTGSAVTPAAATGTSSAHD